MSCGLPAVVTRNGGPSESMVEGQQEFGILVDPADPDDIARGLLRVVGSSESWKAFQAAGIERVLSRYTWDRTAEGYERVFTTIRKGNGRVNKLSIPAYFTDPSEEIPVEDLSKIYFR
jgi:sucrose-phosphate synthase